MGIAATIMSMLTVLVGVVVFSLWAEPDRMRGNRRSALAGFSHLGLAVVAVMLWVFFVIGGSAGLGWVGVGVFALTIVIGIVTVVLTGLRGEQTPEGPAADPVPLAVLIAHGVAALLTIAFAIAAAATR